MKTLMIALALAASSLAQAADTTAYSCETLSPKEGFPLLINLDVGLHSAFGTLNVPFDQGPLSCQVNNLSEGKDLDCVGLLGFGPTEEERLVKIVLTLDNSSSKGTLSGKGTLSNKQLEQKLGGFTGTYLACKRK